MAFSDFTSPDQRSSILVSILCYLYILQLYLRESKIINNLDFNHQYIKLYDNLDFNHYILKGVKEIYIKYDFK